MRNEPAQGEPVRGVVARWASGLERHTVVGPVIAAMSRAGSEIGLPLAMSLAVHAAILVVLLSAAWTHRGEFGDGLARSEVVISLPTPATPPEQAPQPGGEPAPAAPMEIAPPQLQGFSTHAAVAPPVLRSGAGEGISPDDLQLRQDDAAIGATFAGLGARRAGSVVYVVDASGAMVSSLKFVLAELERSVRGLSSAQRFAVVLFRERPGGGSGFDVFVPPGQRAAGVTLVAATPPNKAALASWLETIRPVGRSNPLAGLRRGLAFDPDAIFLLSRSIQRSAGDAGTGVWGRPKAEILAELDRLNPRQGERRRVVIKAIQFLEEDPTGTMPAIGDEHGDGPGSYSVLKLETLGAPAAK